MSTTPESQPREGIRHLDAAIAISLVAVALLLRWWRLDLASFTYDAAEALDRARETLRLGHPPATGIINSLGFRNPGGFIWLLLPSALASPKPEITTAWIGLLTSLSVFPLYAAVRAACRSRLAAAFACGAYALHPVLVFGGRHIWAQNLMPPLAAVGLWGILAARDTTRSQKARSLGAASAIVALSVSATVHLSGIAYLGLALLLLARPAFKRRIAPRATWSAISLMLLIGASTLPSVSDWLDSRRNPRPKPDFAEAFEAHITAESFNPPLIQRLPEAFSGELSLLASVPALGGLEHEVPGERLTAARAGDIIILLVTLGGLATLLLSARRPSQFSPPATGLPGEESPVANELTRGQSRELLIVLSSWLLVPPLLGALLMPRVNGTYFLPAIPALLLLGGVAVSRLELTTARLAPTPRLLLQIVCYFLVAGMVAGYPALILSSLAGVDRSRAPEGVYGLPVVDQSRVAMRAKLEGVSQGHLFHLSGMWFQRGYDYLLNEVAAAPPADKSRPWMLFEDIRLRRDSRARLAWIAAHLPDAIGPVRFATYPDSYAATEAIKEYRALPAHDQP